MNTNILTQNQIATFVLETARPYQILDFDQAFCDLTGHTTEEMLKKFLTLDRLLHKDDFTEVITSIGYQLSISNTMHLETRIITKAGIILPVCMNGEAFYLEDGREVVQCKLEIAHVKQSTTETLTTPSAPSSPSEPDDSSKKKNNVQNDLEVFANTVPSMLSKHLLDNKLSLIWANNYFYTLYGYSAEKFKGRHGKNVLSLIYHEDLSTVINALADLTENTSSKILNFRIVCANKSIKWVNAIFARSGEYQNGFPVVNMVVSDITDLKIAEMKATLEEQKYLIISDISEELPFEYDILEDVFTFAPKYKNVFSGETVLKNPQERLLATGLVSTESADAFSEFCYLMKVGTEYHSTELLLNTRSGGHQWYTATFSTIYDENGEPLRAVGLLRNIHQQKTRQQQLLYKAETDQMTGLFNKVSTETRIKKHLRELDGGKYNVLMLLDIDNFKAINDTFGHLKGDEVIVNIANAILDESGDYGFGGRLGGDEFCMYLDNVLDLQLAEEKATLIADRLRALYPGSENDCKVTLSIGIAATNEQLSYDNLLEHADTALYNAKVRGKDQYCCYDKRLQHVQYENKRQETLIPIADVKPAFNDNHVINELMTILYSSTNTYLAIEKALNILGTTYNIDQISVWEYGFNRSFLDCTHKWCKSYEEHNSLRQEHFPSDMFQAIDTRNQDGMTYISDLSTSSLSGVESTLLAEGIVSLAQAQILMGGSIIGYIDFYNKDASNVWSSSQLELFQIFFMILSEAICSKRRQQNLSLLRDDTVNAFNLVQTPMLVICKDTYDILYYNDAAAEFYPHISINSKCYSSLYEESSPCSSCPLRRLTEGKSLCVCRPNTHFKANMDIYMTPITWNMNRNAFLVYATIHQETSKLPSTDELRNDD